jgi:hypothetical protein
MEVSFLTAAVTSCQMCSKTKIPLVLICYYEGIVHYEYAS